MTDVDSNKDHESEPELELELVSEAAPETASGDAAADTSADPGADPGADSGTDPGAGQWVWQFAAAPPPPSFLAVFFSGTAHKELYRFFGCALMVVIGCLLPWGPVTDTVPDPNGVDGALVEVVRSMPGVAGYETPAGAISLLLGLYLLFSSCYGIYTRRQKILPVFLMLEPAAVSLMRTLDAWDKLESESALDKIGELFEVAGSGVMLTLAGSGFVAVGFLFLLGKVYTKKDDKGAARRGARDKGAPDSKGKGKDKSKAKDKKKGKQADEAAASSTSDEKGDAVADDGASKADSEPAKSSRSRSRRR